MTQFGTVSNRAEGAEETKLIDETVVRTSSGSRNSQTSYSSGSTSGYSGRGSSSSGLGIQKKTSPSNQEIVMIFALIFCRIHFFNLCFHIDKVQKNIVHTALEFGYPDFPG